jgi:hypothetical protein
VIIGETGWTGRNTGWDGKAVIRRGSSKYYEESLWPFGAYVPDSRTGLKMGESSYRLDEKD